MKFEILWNLDAPTQHIVDAETGEKIFSVNYDDGPEAVTDCLKKVLEHADIDIEEKEVPIEEM